MAIINKAVNFLMTESEEEQHYNFDPKKETLAKNLICDPIIKDKKIIGLYIYLIKESTLAEDEEVNQAFWIDGYFNEKGEFLGRGEGFDDDLIWSTY